MSKLTVDKLRSQLRGSTVVAGDEDYEEARDSDAIAPYSEKGGYFNFMADDDRGRVRENYGANYQRLVSIKRKYDPGNLFHLNQNIKP